MLDIFTNLFIPVFGVIGTGAALIAGGLASAAASAYSANKAAQTAKNAASASQVDIDALDQKTRAIALKNAQDSAELEKQLTPEVPQLRTAANNAVLGNLGQDAATKQSSSYLTSNLGKDVAGPAYSPLLKAAIAKAQANLDLGGKLDTETQNAVTRAGLAKAGGVTGGDNLGLGRDIVARDLGLTSLQLQQQRLQEAAALGNQELQGEQFNVGTKFNNAANVLNQIQLLRSISEGGFNKALSAAQYGQSIRQPVVGLDPGSVADVVAGNATNRSAALANQANIQGAQGQGFMNLAGQLGGYGLMSYMNQNPNNPYKLPVVQTSQNNAAIRNGV